MRELKPEAIKYLVIHCSATKPGMNIGADEIREWHKARGWEDIGYHYVIRRDGTVQTGRDEKFEGSHVFGYNHLSLGICMVGGLDAKGEPAPEFTPPQWASLESLVLLLKKRFPRARVRGHRDFNPAKACPSFDVAQWLQTIGLEN